MATETLWIIVAVVVAVLLIAAALGTALRRRRRISLREPERIEQEPGTAPPRQGGTYKTESGFSFSAGTAAPERPAEKAAPEQPVDRPAPPAAPPAAESAAPEAPPAPPRAPQPPPAPPAREVPHGSSSRTAADRTDAPDPAPPLAPPVAAPQERPLRDAAAPATAAPDTVTPAAVTPDTVTPHAVTPDAVTPDTVTPDATTPTTAAPTTAAPITAAPDTAAPDAAAPDAAAPDAAAPDAAAPDVAAPDVAAPTTAAPTTAIPDTAAPDTADPRTSPSAPAVPAVDVPEVTATGSSAVAPERPAPEQPPAVPTTPFPPGPPRPDEPRSTNGAAPTLTPPTPTPPTPAPPAPAPTTPAPADTPAPVPTTAHVPAPVPVDDIDPAEGRLDRLRGRLARSRSGFGQGLLGLLGAGELDEESWEDVEATLLQADLGPETTVELVETLRVELARRAVRTPAQARQLLRDVLTAALRPELDRSVRALPHDGRPAVLLVVGVNGTGKTTTTGKLARVLVAGGRHVVLGAADTFRAAAAEQLGTWGRRAGATVVRGPEGADPASVAFDAVKQGAAEGADAVLLDTAGRLHTKTGLMDELGKVKRVVSRQAEVDEVLLVLDATTGQNGLTQARVFRDVVDVSGIVLTKLDGTAKGGIVFRVQRELGVPVKLVGLGEGPDDLAPFEPAAFVDALLT